MPHKFGISSPYHARWVLSVKRISQKAFFKHALDPVCRKETFNGLQTLKVEIGTGSVICMASDLLPVDEKNWNVPVWLI